MRPRFSSWFWFGLRRARRRPFSIWDVLFGVSLLKSLMPRKRRW